MCCEGESRLTWMLFFPEDAGTKKVNSFMCSWWQYCNSLPRRWLCSPVLHIRASNGVGPCHLVLNRAFLQIIVKQKVNSAEILRMLNAISFLKAQTIQDTSVIWQGYGKCVLEFRRSDSCYFLPHGITINAQYYSNSLHSVVHQTMWQILLSCEVGNSGLGSHEPHSLQPRI
jgi:hypothetical protein